MKYHELPSLFPNLPLIYPPSLLHIFDLLFSFIFTGASGALDLAITALLNPGDNLLIPLPGFSLYECICGSKGFVVKRYKLLVILRSLFYHSSSFFSSLKLSSYLYPFILFLGFHSTGRTFPLLWLQVIFLFIYLFIYLAREELGNRYCSHEVPHRRPHSCDLSQQPF